MVLALYPSSFRLSILLCDRNAPSTSTDAYPRSTGPVDSDIQARQVLIGSSGSGSSSREQPRPCVSPLVFFELLGFLSIAGLCQQLMPFSS